MSAKQGPALVIVESPTKAKTISKFLPSGYVVEASVGHIRDLPTSAKEIPAAYKKEAWSRLGIDIDNDFQPLYVVPQAKKKQVQKLKALVKDASEIYLATDEDREGESISWHLVQVLNPKVPIKRLVFHEITKTAIEKALAEPRELDEGLVQAQETRRLLDRLYGYELSPILWRKIGPGLSAGRVQSVAVKLIVERERERQRFVRATYWDLSGAFAAKNGNFEATLATLDGKRVASGKDFDQHTGKLKAGSDAQWVDEARAQKLASDLKSADWAISKVERKPYTDRPSPPFTTSTLQQEANRKLRLTARAAMQAAQRLYENGYITYMRTDSTSLAKEAVETARAQIEKLYGADYVPDQPREYRTKVKNAQEAHEAIRPAGEFVTPDSIKGKVGVDELRVYELIWKRTMACQMADARGHRLSLEVTGAGAVFQASGKTIEFPGYMRAYVEGADDPDAELADKETVLPSVTEGESVECTGLEAKDHTTQPPARFTEASIVKELESNGVGRPSTYAMIIDTILRREYVVKQRNALVPTFMAFAVVGLLERHFGHLVDVTFTARMEDDLDMISLGQKESLPYLQHFYFGAGGDVSKASDGGLKALLEQEIDPRESCTLPLGLDAEGRAIAVRIGRYGPYLERGDERATIPEGIAPDELTIEKAVELIERGSGPTELGDDPDTGRPAFLKAGRFGPYVQLGDNDDEPKMKSLLPGMVPEEVTLESAMRLLRLPREVGVDPATSEPVLADFGRYGPYLKRGTDTRSLEAPEQVFEIDLEQALVVLATEKKGGFRRGPKALRDVGTDPAGNVVKLLDGRYGPYVTDGTTNASIPKGTNPDDVTLELSLELIAARVAAGPSKKKKAKKKVAKKKAATKKAAKKTAKKATKKASKKTVKKAADDGDGA
ncbi:type I DNA topoisomerase [Engelhardtia mirabilis]|uniref:DNA topoisomerase 1 n=1 Tax=Engelhardtia mirabilis TaxID=2528011 RepID=A0A518BFK3_9BACT|nr:DNA topoisomerase 1 [Planctomycetes bacterium Pla133]QDV00084.1 DNA topoisomerase 1 [Planctomycetes bacterium Pla86]